MLTLPAIIFACLFASLYGVLFHLILGGGSWRLLSYVLLSWAGFAVGHFLGLAREWIFFMLGSLNFGMATVGSVAFLIVGHLIIVRLDNTEEDDDAV